MGCTGSIDTAASTPTEETARMTPTYVGPGQGQFVPGRPNLRSSISTGSGSLPHFPEGSLQQLRSTGEETHIFFLQQRGSAGGLGDELPNYSEPSLSSVNYSETETEWYNFPEPAEDSGKEKSISRKSLSTLHRSSAAAVATLHSPHAEEWSSCTAVAPSETNRSPSSQLDYSASAGSTRNLFTNPLASPCNAIEGNEQLVHQITVTTRPNTDPSPKANNSCSLGSLPSSSDGDLLRQLDDERHPSPGGNSGVEPADPIWWESLVRRCTSREQRLKCVVDALRHDNQGREQQQQRRGGGATKPATSDGCGSEEVKNWLHSAATQP